jgi:hypothetical protein
MKKLILFLLLILTINTTFAQETPQQFRRVYSEIAIIKGDDVSRAKSENTILFNYGNEAVIKMYMADGSLRYFDQVAGRGEGNTEGGMGYNGAMFKDRHQGMTVYVQLFEDRQYGVRLIFKNGDMIQFFEY